MLTKNRIKIMALMMPLFVFVSCSSGGAGNNKIDIEPSEYYGTQDLHIIEGKTFNDPFQEFVVSFYNYDGTLLSSISVRKGTAAIYNGETPTKPDDDEFTYEFAGWDKELTKVKQNIETTATYKATSKTDWGDIEWF